MQGTRIPAKVFPRKSRSALISLIAGATVLAQPLHAQTVAAPTREALQVAPPPRAVAGASHLTVAGDIERGPCPLADPAYAAVKVSFRSVQFVGLEAVPAEDLAPAWSAWAGREIPIAELCEVRDRAATILREKGFLAAVQVPPQRIEPDGTVRMDVLLARLVDVEVHGNPGHAERLIAAHLRRLTAQRWFNVNAAERHLLLLRDLPGFDVRLILRPAGSAPGEVVGEVEVKRQPIELVASVQNLGSSATGPGGGFVQVILNDVTGLGDRTVLSLYNTADTREQTVVQLAHDLALGADGLRLGGKLLYQTGHPSLGAGDFRTETKLGQVNLQYPIVRRQAMSLNGILGFEAIDQKVDFGATHLSRDRLRVGFVRIDADAADRASLRSAGGYTAGEPRWHAAGTLELRQGIAGFGASPRCLPITLCLAPNVGISNIYANPAAFVARFESAFEYRPTPDVTLAFAPRAQYSASELLGYEQFSLGNYTIGRGFDPGTLQGDSGVGSSLELRVGRLTPKSEKAVTIQPFVFVDAAWTWTNDGGITPDPRHLWSAGGGVRARWGDHADFNLALAIPLERAGFQTKRGAVRVLFTVTTRLVPWSES